jgi:hypothetical protein
MIDTHAAQSPVERDWRFAALVARSWAEPALIDRYAEDPHLVLAEYGLVIDDEHDAPSLDRMTEVELLIEDLDWSAKPLTRSCAICSSDSAARPVSAPSDAAESLRRR